MRVAPGERLKMPTNSTTAPMLTMAEAAEYLAVTNRMMRRLQSERRVAFVRVGRHIRFRPVDLDAFIEDNSVGAAR